MRTYNDIYYILCHTIMHFVWNPFAYLGTCISLSKATVTSAFTTPYDDLRCRTIYLRFHRHSKPIVSNVTQYRSQIGQHFINLRCHPSHDVAARCDQRFTYSMKTIAGSISSHVSREKYIAVTIVTEISWPRPILLWWVEIILSAPMYCIVSVKLTNIKKREWE